MLGCYSVKKLASVKTIKVNTNIPWEKKALTAGQIIWIRETELMVMTNM